MPETAALSLQVAAESASKTQPEDSHHKHPLKAAYQPDGDSQVPLRGMPASSSQAQSWKDDEHLSMKKAANLSLAIRELGHLIPDDMRAKSLLDPLVSTGEALLRELAYRVRAFKEAFAAWENLHLDVLQGRLHRNLDVVQQLKTMDLPAKERIQAIHTYEDFRFYVNSLAARLFPWTTTYFGDHMSLHASFYDGGRGIVLTAGDNQVEYLMTSIPSFRKLGCDLPIEVLYLGDDDLGEDSIERLEGLPNVLTRDLSKIIDDSGWTLKGWAAKPFAILMSSFREAIFVDADALFFSNPELLFEDEQYQDTGALFFKDRNLSPENKKKWLREILPSPISSQVKKSRMWTGESGHMQDSGVVVIDKWRHFVSLLLTTRMNGPDRDGDEVKGERGVYEMVYGDKETFWLSWELAADLDYAFHDSVAGTMGILGKFEDVKGKSNSSSPNSSEGDDLEISPIVCSAQLLHFDRPGRPLWFNGWIEKRKADEDDPLDLADFEVYMKEPQEIGRRPKTSLWDIKESNIVCLSGKQSFRFDKEEHATLEMIKGLARARER